MRWIKLTALTSFLFASLLIISSCERYDELKKIAIYSKTGIVMSGAQEIPVSASTATGTLDVTYSKSSKTLNYTFKWSGLTGVPNGIGIYGLAPVGYAVSPASPIQTISLTGLTASSSYSGSLAVDGVFIKEQDLLNELFYINIRTVANPGGEIRAQIRFH